MTGTPPQAAVHAGDQTGIPSTARPQRPLRVMQLILGLQVGGLESMVVKLASALPPQHYRSLVCCIDQTGPLADELQQAGIEVLLLKRGQSGTDWRYPRRLAQLLKQQQVDILHLHNPTALFYGAPAGRLAGIRPIIYTEHGRDYSRSWKSRLINRLLTRMVDRVVVLHERARHYMHEREGAPLKRIVKIYNGIADPGGHGPAERQQMRESLGLEADITAIGIVARLDPIKNLPILITAMQQLHQQRAPARLLIIGDGPLRDSLEQQVTDNHLDPVVQFLGTRHDIPQLLSALDLLVLPSSSEGLSMTLIEGSAAGLPLIASDVGGNNELVDDGVNGLLVKPGDSDALATALLQLTADPALARRMGVASRQRYRQYFDAATMLSGYQALYALQR